MASNAHVTAIFSVHELRLVVIVAETAQIAQHGPRRTEEVRAGQLTDRVHHLLPTERGHAKLRAQNVKLYDHLSHDELHRQWRHF